MTNSADPDQLASEEANWSGSTLFAKTGHDAFSKRWVNIFFVGGLVFKVTPVGRAFDIISKTILIWTNVMISFDTYKTLNLIFIS